MKIKLLVIGVVVSICILFGTVIYAANVLNQDVGVTIEVKPQPTTASPTPTYVTVYKDIAMTEVMTTLDLSYTVGNGMSTVGYIPASQSVSLYYPIITSSLSGFDFTTELGNEISGAREVVIHVSGGTVGNYTGTITLRGGE